MRVADTASRQPLSARDRRALLFGFGCIAAVLILGRGGPALRRWTESERLSAREFTSRAREQEWISAQAPRLRSVAAEQLSRLAALDSLVLRARSRSEAAAKAAGLVTGLAEEAGLRVTSVSVTPDSGLVGPFTVVGVRVSATGDVAGLATSLRWIEASDVLLAVRSISIVQPDPGAQASQPEALRLEFLAEALVRMEKVE